MESDSLYQRVESNHSAQGTRTKEKPQTIGPLAYEALVRYHARLLTVTDKRGTRAFDAGATRAIAS